MSAEQKLTEIIRSVVGEEMAKFVEEQRKANKVSFAELMQANVAPMREEKGLNMARFVRAMAAGKGDPERAMHYAKKVWGEDSAVYKAMTATEPGEGGFLVPEQYATEVIELLTAQSVVRKMGAVSVPMPTGTLNISRITGGASAYYVGESQNIPASKLATGQLKLTWKKLATLVPVSNDLLRFSSPSADALVRESLIVSMALKEDLAFIRGAGTEYVPKGLRYWAPAGNLITMSTSGGNVTVDTVTFDLLKAIYKLRNANCKFVRPGWIISARTELYLKSLRVNTGEYAFKNEMDQGRILGFPYAVTTQIPENLGAGGNETEVYLVDFADAIIGESTQMFVEVSSDASYVDENTGELVSAFSRDETVMRVISQHDFGMRHDACVAVITGVTWGSSMSL